MLPVTAPQALYAGQELHLLPYSSLGERRALCPYELLEGLIKTVAELSKAEQADLGAAAEWVASNEEAVMPVWHCFSGLQDMCCDAILVDKSPPYADHVSYLDHAHAIFGSAARYVHLVRHPYACIESGAELVVKYLRNDAFNKERGGDPSLAWPSVEAAWAAAQKNVNEFMARTCVQEASEATSHIDTLRPRAQRILYEDLLREPERVLTKICQLMQVAYEPNMAEPYDTEAIQTFRSAQSVSTTDPKLLRRKKIDAAQADKWRRVRLPQPLIEEARVLARGFGYELE